MQQLALASTVLTASIHQHDQVSEFVFPLSPTDHQADVVYFDRPGEVHVNLALGRLCSVGCRECSATILGRRLLNPLRGNLSPDAIQHKLRGIVGHLAPLMGQRRLVISTMNDGDPLSRPAEELAVIANRMVATCAEAGIRLDRLNFSSSLIPNRANTVVALADRYHEVFGANLVQFQGSLLATHVKQNIWAGDRRHLSTMVETLAYYGTKMRAATGRGATWMNYVAVKCGDFERADGALRLDSVAVIAEALRHANGTVQLKITRGTVDDLAGWQQLDHDAYAEFVAAVQQRWGMYFNIYAPDLISQPPVEYGCGRIQALAV